MSEYLTHRATQAVALVPVTAAGFKKFLGAQSAPAKAWAKAQGFTALPGTLLQVPDARGNLAAVWVAVEEGAGHIWSLAHLPAALPAGAYRLESAWRAEELSQVALGFRLAQYQFTRYKKSEAKAVTLVLPKAVDLAAIERQVSAITLVRDLINVPASDMGPADLAMAAKRLAKTLGAQFREIVGEDLLSENYPAIHAVGRAAEQAPRLIELAYGKKSHPLVVLVGKGVTFDTGGLDLKPYASMKLMKKDMGGAALVLGLAQRIIEEKLPIRLLVLIPAVENSVSGNAFRPQDILASRKGLSIEIGSTDAEGRLILADALARAAEEKPALIVDVATLTGAARTALGPELPALYSNRDAIAQELMHVGATQRDPLWHLPLWKPYAKYVNSPIADVTNTPNFGFAGSITAALFLERFVTPETPWVHLDSYAWNAESQPGRPAGGEALGLRALFAYLQKRFG